ncbi:MAG: PIN domain-containing protein [Defluviitaleaceae bacterium]|nr:PIN domain-containing protein [Defluviitaleaceae bacterium]
MKILIDTNVVLDVLQIRQPYFESSAKIFEWAAKNKKGSITAAQTTDIFYFVRKGLKNAEQTKQILLKMQSRFEVLSVLHEDVDAALASDMSDYEDALIAHCAARHGVNYIVTRNAKDFESSPVVAITPEDFLLKVYKG